MLTGCTSGSLDLFDGTAKVDRNLSTGTVPKRPTETVSDEITVRNAVTSADLAKLGSSPLPWANTATGSAGVVSHIHEVTIAGISCRNFTTTRHAYDGIANFSGRACYSGGQWTLTAFDRQ